MNSLQVTNMRTSSPVKRESLLDKMADGMTLIILTGMVFAIWFIAGYLAAHM